MTLMKDGPTSSGICPRLTAIQQFPAPWPGAESDESESLG